MKEEYPEIPEFIKKLIDAGQEIDEIKLDAEGNWFHNGEGFKNKKIARFFSEHIDITREGEYVISYDDFVYPVVVEDAPVFITGIKIEGKGEDEKIYLSPTRGEVEKLDIDTLHYKKDCLYCYVNNGKFLAKFNRSPSFELLYRLEETDDIYYIHLGGKKLVLGEKI